MKKKMVSFILVLASMVALSMLLIMGLSYVTFLRKWQAKEALFGIYVIYIFTGFCAGIIYKKVAQLSERRIVVCMFRGIEVGTLFLLFMVVVVLFYFKEKNIDIQKLMMIWMIITSSSSLGILLSGGYKKGKK